MKYLLIIIAVLVLAGCEESQYIKPLNESLILKDTIVDKKINFFSQLKFKRKILVLFYFRGIYTTLG